MNWNANGVLNKAKANDIDFRSNCFSYIEDISPNLANRIMGKFTQQPWETKVQVLMSKLAVQLLVALESVLILIEMYRKTS